MAVRRQENELAFWNRRRISISWPSRHRVLPIILRTETGDTDSDQGDEQSCVGSIQHADVVNGAMSEPPIRNERGGGWCREEVRVGGLWTEQRAARTHYAPKVRLLLAPLGIEQRRFVLTKAETPCSSISTAVLRTYLRVPEILAPFIPEILAG